MKYVRASAPSIIRWKLLRSRDSPGTAVSQGQEPFAQTRLLSLATCNLCICWTLRVQQTGNKTAHSVLLKTMDKKKQSKASYAFSRDYKYMHPVNLLFRPFKFCCCLKDSFSLKDWEFHLLFFLRSLQAGMVRGHHSNIDLQEVSKLLMKTSCFYELAKRYLRVFNFYRV